MFTLKDNQVSVKAGMGFYAKIDLGIVKYHLKWVPVKLAGNGCMKKGCYFGGHYLYQVSFSKINRYMHLSATCTVKQFRVVFGLRLALQPLSLLTALYVISVRQTGGLPTPSLQIPPRDGHPWCSAMPFPLPGGLWTFTL